MQNNQFNLASFFLCFPLCLSGLVCGQEAVADAERFDGIYFLYGGRRILRIEKNTFRLRKSDSYYEGELSGTFIFGSFLFFDGFKEARVDATMGVVDNHLWAGVLCRMKGHDGKESWGGGWDGAAFFAPPAEDAKDLRLAWCPEDGSWYYFRRFDHKENIKHEVRGIKMVSDPRGKNGTSRFTLLHSEEFRRFPYLVNQWDIDEAKKHSHKEGKEDEWFEKLGHYFERKGDVVLTPWSVDLGQIGLKPVEIQEKDVLGTWSDEADGTLVEFHRQDEAPKPDRSQLLMGLFGKRDRESINKMFEHAHFKPNLFGVTHYATGWNCVMGHMDFPFHVYWIPLTKTRMVRYVSKGGCYGGGTLPQSGIRFFKKKE